MVKKATRRPAIKTLSIIKSRDIIVDKLLKPCEDGAHSKCTGWAVLKKELSPINANYFLRCACTCHHKRKQKLIKKKQLQPKIKKKSNRKLIKKKQELNKRGKRGKSIKNR
jgi:hypothetical protein